jgi:GNAT superfamily N-acetyltransferase
LGEVSGGSGDLSAPEPIADHHDLEAFDSGEPELDSWLRRRALANEREHASRTFVVCSGGVVVGYYCLAAGSVTHADAPGSIRRNMPQPIPVIVLGRLAVDRRWSGKGIGAGLLKDAVLRSLQVTQEIAARALLVHAISQPARQFYLKFGFIESPIDPMTLMLNLSKLPSARPRPSP